MKAGSPAARRYCTDLLERLVNIPSVFPNEEELMIFLERELTTLGLRPARIEVEEGRFNLLCSLGSGSPRLCLNAHADTVPPNGESVPSARIEGDLLHGLGSCDDKASIAAMVTAYLELAAVEGELASAVDLLISVDEEGDGKGIKAAIAQGYKCDYAIVGEPTGLDIVHAHCGLLFLRPTTLGVSAHGCRPENGVNAIERMMALVEDLRAALGRFAPHETVGAPSLNLGEVHAGDRPNRVPDKCQARVDIRLAPPARAAEVLEAVMEVVDSKGWASCEVEKRGETLDTPIDSPLVGSILGSAQSLGIDSSPIGWRGWTEAEPFRTLLGIDSVVLGPGDLKQAHSAREFVSISQTHLAAALYADVAKRVR